MLTPVPGEQLTALAATAPPPEAAPSTRRRVTLPPAGDFDIDQWIATYAPDAGAAEAWPGGGVGARRWVFKVCPVNADHTDHSACITQHSSGRLGFTCQHNGCAGEDWHTFRALRGPAPVAAPVTPHEMHSVAVKSGVATETNLALRFRTAREIAEETPGSIEWAAEPWLVFGSITEIDAKIKLGKTTWTLAMCRAMLDGRPFMGQPTSKTPIVYLTEQPPRSFREALRRADLGARDDLVVLYHHDTRGTAWPAVVAAAVAKAHEIGARALMVDTLPQFASLKGDLENSAGAALEAVEPLQDAAAIHGLAVAIVRHERKSGGDVGDSGRGSSAFGGAVDVVLSLRRGEGNTRPSIRLIHALSRFDETPDTLTIELDKETGEYQSLGTETAVAVPEAMAAIVAAAPQTEATAETRNQLLARVKSVRETVGKEAIEKLHADGVLGRKGPGVKGSPYRYWRRVPSIHSVATSPLSRDRMNGDHPEENELLSVATTVPATERMWSNDDA